MQGIIGESNIENKIIVICGATASGKTTLAVKAARELKARGLYCEIISADSRQVYRGMDIGTGKDIEEYGVGEEEINVHCLDIADPHEIFTLANFKSHCLNAIDLIREKNGIPIICGGTGLYIEAILNNYQLPLAPEDESFRNKMEKESKESLQELLREKDMTRFNATDINSKKRLIRALEIVKYYEENLFSDSTTSLPSSSTQNDALILITRWPREELLARIDSRLDERLKEGMIPEIEKLITKKVTRQRLQMFGMEYSHVGEFIFEGSREEDYIPMRNALATSIHRLSKRQMTWFRGMERRGLSPHWIDKAEFNLSWKLILKFLQ